MNGFEIIIRSEDDEKKLQEMLAAGWKIKNRGTMMIKGEPDRVFLHLYKEDSASK